MKTNDQRANELIKVALAQDSHGVGRRDTELAVTDRPEEAPIGFPDLMEGGAIEAGQSRPEVNPDPDLTGSGQLLADMARSGRRMEGDGEAERARMPEGDAASFTTVARGGGEAGGMALRAGASPVDGRADPRTGMGDPNPMPVQGQDSGMLGNLGPVVPRGTAPTPFSEDSGSTGSPALDVPRRR